MVNLTDPALRHTPFPGKHENEQFQFYFRQHWIRLLKPFTQLILSVVVIFVVGYISFFGLNADPSARHGTLLILFFLFLLANLLFLIAFYRYFLYVIIVTDRKIHRIKKTLLAVDDHQSIDLWVLQDIFKSQHGIIQNMFGFGTLIMEAQETQLRIHFIPGIQEKYETLMHLRERARAVLPPQPGTQPRPATELKVDL